MVAIQRGSRIAAGFWIVALSVAVSACTSLSPDGTEAAGTDEQTGEATQALTGTHRVCSAIAPGNWRDSIIVDSGWSNLTCAGWAGSVGASTHQLGCLFDTGFSWGAGAGGLPSPNCGWF